jgi:hypothetical protein
MYNLNNNKKKNSVARTTFLLLSTILVVAGVSAPLAALQPQSSEAFINPNNTPGDALAARAPVVASGDNIYVAWWTNSTANKNEEVMFRTSNDGGQTFSDKINLSNTNDADSWRVEIAGEGANVIVTWWETNNTSDTPVARTSTDGGQTFGPMLRLANNGGITNTEGQGG